MILHGTLDLVIPQCDPSGFEDSCFSENRFADDLDRSTSSSPQLLYILLVGKFILRAATNKLHCGAAPQLALGESRALNDRAVYCTVYCVQYGVDDESGKYDACAPTRATERYFVHSILERARNRTGIDQSDADLVFAPFAVLALYCDTYVHTQ
jgi:hypothetical protein